MNGLRFITNRIIASCMELFDAPVDMPTEEQYQQWCKLAGMDVPEIHVDVFVGEEIDSEE